MPIRITRSTSGKITKPATVKSHVKSEAAAPVREQQGLKIGDEMPELVLKNEKDEDVNLRQLVKDNRIVLIFAYPKASTPGCTRQAIGYGENYENLKKMAKIYGLSSDTPKAQASFIEKKGFKVDGLLSDPKKQLIGTLGAKKSPNGIKRSHWIFVDGRLKVSRVQVSPEVSVNDGKKEVEEIYAELQKESESESESEKVKDEAHETEETDKSQTVEDHDASEEETVALTAANGSEESKESKEEDDKSDKSAEPVTESKSL